MKRTILLLLALIMVFSLCACGSGSEEPTEIASVETETATVEPTAEIEASDKATIIDNAGQTVEMSASELVELYNENTAKFDKYYEGATISFEGTVKKIDSNFYFENSNIPFDSIAFEEGWTVYILHGSYDELLVELSAGDKLNVNTQVYTAIYGFVDLRGCKMYGDSIVYSDETLQTTEITIASLN